MRYAWKVSRLPHLIFDTDNPIILGGRAMALDRRNNRIRGKVVAASPKIVVLKTSLGTRRLSRAVWTIAPIEGEHRTMPYVSALLKASRRICPRTDKKCPRPENVFARTT
jgi:hypothetical protein